MKKFTDLLDAYLYAKEYAVEQLRYQQSRDTGEGQYSATDLWEKSDAYQDYLQTKEELNQFFEDLKIKQQDK